ncbi:Jerky like protein, partial [Dictyocoela muelleri]
SDIYAHFESNKSNECIRRNRMPIKTAVFDSDLYEWFQNKKIRNFLISQDNLKTMAKNLTEKYQVEGFTASDGYIQRFRARYNKKSRVSRGIWVCKYRFHKTV